MEAMELKSMDLDKFGEFKHGGRCLNMQEDHFGRSLFLVVLTSEGYFGNYEKFVRFLEKAISGKIVSDFQSFKTS